jgi:hypothetical protein
MAKCKKQDRTRKSATNVAYKATNRKEKNRLAKLLRASKRNPNDAQTSEALVKQWLKVYGKLPS